jgi:hypothetical protein
MTYKPFFSNDGHLDELGIALYTDAISLNKTITVPADITRHVEDCDYCKQQILAVADLMDNQSFHIPTSHPTLDLTAQRSTVPEFWYRAAAVLLFAIISSTAYVFVANQNVHTPAVSEVPFSPVQPAASEPVTEQQKSDPLLADNFSASPNLEGMLRTEFRSPAVEVFSPSIGERVRPPITFRWRGNGHPMKLKVLTNKEVTILTAIVLSDSFRSEKQYHEGLYYWKLEANEEMIFLGKFFVK